MKKYLWLGLAVVMLGVCGALVYRAQSSACPEYKGLRGEAISPAGFSQWIVPDDNVLFEIQKNGLYVQEAIGSTGILLRSPRVIQSNFAFALDLMSMTQSARLRLSVKNQQGHEMYSFDLQQLKREHRATLQENGKKLGTAQGEVLLPDRLYPAVMEKSGKQLILSVNGKEILKAPANNEEGGGYIELAIEGQPDHPAAFEFKNVILYQ